MASVYLLLVNIIVFMFEVFLAMRRISAIVRIKHMNFERVDPRQQSAMLVVKEKLEHQRLQWFPLLLSFAFLLPPFLTGVALVLVLFYSRDITLTHLYHCALECKPMTTHPGIDFASGGFEKKKGKNKQKFKKFNHEPVTKRNQQPSQQDRYADQTGVEEEHDQRDYDDDYDDSYNDRYDYYDRYQEAQLQIAKLTEALAGCRPSVCKDPPNHPQKIPRKESYHLENPKIPSGIFSNQVSVRVEGSHIGYAFGTSCGVFMPAHVYEEAVNRTEDTGQDIVLTIKTKSLVVPRSVPVARIPAQPDHLIHLKMVWPFAQLTRKYADATPAAYIGIQAQGEFSSSNCQDDGVTLHYRATTHPGDSGAFVVSSNGKVVGIHQQGGTENQATKLTQKLIDTFFRPFNESVKGKGKAGVSSGKSTPKGGASATS